MQYDHLKNNLSNCKFFNNETKNYVNLVEYVKDNIEEKFENLNIHTKLQKNKRGIINGFGSIIKAITGNLDAEDGEKINSILEHLKTNEANLQSQINNQYSLSHEIISNFNETIQNIQENEINLKSKILAIKDIVDFQTNLENINYLKDMFNEIIITYNLILDTMENVQNSITFCKLKTLHPSKTYKTQEFNKDVKDAPLDTVIILLLNIRKSAPTTGVARF
uniref:Uncharacterized protein LOC114339659 n=1 Tax=Diabrotica virgifera virgifera TaxID=50390 RepID=A0A6P7GA57_DIAVI